MAHGVLPGIRGSAADATGADRGVDRRWAGRCRPGRPTGQGTWLPPVPPSPVLPGIILTTGPGRPASATSAARPIRNANGTL